MYTVGIITISDKGAAGRREDKSGPKIRQMLPKDEYEVVSYKIMPEGIGYNLWKGITEAVDKDGFIGLFRGGFQMAAVGSSAALIFGYIASLIFKPKMTK